MKNKLLSLLLASLLLVLAFASCGETNPGTPDDKNPSSSDDAIDSGGNGDSGAVSPVPPGTLPAVDDLPKADPSLVGQTVTVSLSKGGRNFYYYDKENNRERLIVIEEIPDDPAPVAAKLVIYEPDFDGLAGFLQLLEQPASAKVLGVVNISYEEFHYTAGALPGSDSSYSMTAAEIIDPKGTLAENENAVQFYSIFVPGPYSTGLSTFVCGNIGNERSERLQRLLEVLERIYQRFSLNETMDLDRSTLLSSAEGN